MLVKKQFPEIRFLLNSESAELFPHGSTMNKHYLVDIPLRLKRFREKNEVHKKLSASEIVYEVYKNKGHQRVLLRLEENSWLFWFGLPFSLMPRLRLPKIVFSFPEDISVKIDENWRLFLRANHCTGRLDSFCAGYTRPFSFSKSESNVNGKKDIKLEFLYCFKTRNPYKRIKYSAFDVFWIFQTGVNDFRVPKISPTYEKYRYRKALTNVDISLGDRRYGIFIPQRSGLVKFPGYERIAQKNEITVIKFVEGEADLLWTVSGNEIKQYG
jgi:hypothetical protein